MMFITHDGAKITAIYSGDPSKVNAKTFEVPETFQGTTGMPLAMLDAEWRRRPTEELIEEGIIPKPNGFVWDREKRDWRSVTKAELVADGRLELGPREKVEGDLVVEKSMGELDAEGLLTAEERAEWERDKALARLRAVDYESTRPMRAKLVGTATVDDEEMLRQLENEAKQLRSEVATWQRELDL